LERNLSLQQLQDLKFFNLFLSDSLQQSGEYLEQSIKVVRELLFEFYRQKVCPTRPSRLHCIWLCEKDYVDNWWKEFEDCEDKYILEVNATGELFQADGGYVTYNVTQFSDFVALATKYWGGKPFEDPKKRQTELLFIGELEIVNRLEQPPT
jgi:hypothetical protein